jgi:purine-binding chemotaxis protein CheW
MSMGDEIQLVTFRLGGHDLAFNVFEVERVLRYEEPTPLPDSPDFLLGTLSFGSEVVPVVDLRSRLRVRAAVEDVTRIIVVQWEHGRLGVVVDAVLEVTKVPANDIVPPPQFVKGLAAECVGGFVSAGNRTIVVLAVAKLLASNEQLALDALMAEIPHG